MMPAACRNDCRSLIRWPRYELPVPEHPGFGGSDDPPAIHSVPDLATFYLDRVEEGGEDRIHIIGSSLGGWLAADILFRDRSRVRSLVQLAPAGIRVKGVPVWQQFHLGARGGSAQPLS
jgi:pimeloyl-ACP methyl ester carboxylesterase